MNVCGSSFMMARLTMSVTILRPMPFKFGVGFVAEKPLPDDFVAGYRHENVGMYHNYHVTECDGRGR